MKKWTIGLAIAGLLILSAGAYAGSKSFSSFPSPPGGWTFDMPVSGTVGTWISATGQGTYGIAVVNRTAPEAEHIYKVQIYFGQGGASGGAAVGTYTIQHAGLGDIAIQTTFLW